MPFKIYTYEDPYKLDKADFWSEISALPHFCGARTLVNGLKDVLGDNIKGLICPLDELVQHEEVYMQWTDNISLRVQQYSAFSSAFKQLLEKRRISKPFHMALEQNQNHFLEAVRLFIELDISASAIDGSKGNTEQKLFVHMLKKAQESSLFRFPKTPSREKLKEIVIALAKKEVEECTGTPQEVKRCERAVSVTKEQPFDSIVVHGVHQFTPVQLRLLLAMEKMGMTIIFLFNYQKKYSKIYSSWNDIYGCFEVPIHHDTVVREYTPPTMQNPSNALACALGEICEDRNAVGSALLRKWYKLYKSVQLMEFANITEYAHFVSNHFDAAIQRYSESRSVMERGNDVWSNAAVLRHLDEQVYTANRDVHTLLKIYYPEYAKDRHFLSYPIGQFFSAIYRLWDYENGKIIFDVNAIKECLSSNILSVAPGEVLLRTFYNVAILFENVTTYDEFQREIVEGYAKNYDKLADTPGNDALSELKNLSIYNKYKVTKKDLLALIRAIEEINEIATYLFALDNSREDFINFGKHFRNLEEFLKQRELALANEQERALITALQLRLDKIKPEQSTFSGTFRDLKEGLYYYLKQKNDEDQGVDWIVKNYEQIDGDILQSKRQFEKEQHKVYHFACVSDRDMNMTVNDQLPWPLTDEFIRAAYSPIDLQFQVYYTALGERSNFLRYALFYGLCYNRCDVRLSFVKQYGDETTEPYALLAILGLKPKAELVESVNKPAPFSISVGQELTKGIKYDRFQMMDMFLCPYRFFLDYVMENGPVVQGNFLYQKYFENLLIEAVWKRVGKQKRSDAMKYLPKILEQEAQKLEPFFKFWKATEIFDLKLRAKNYLIHEVITEGYGSTVKPYAPSHMQMRKLFGAALFSVDVSEVERKNPYAEFEAIAKREGWKKTYPLHRLPKPEDQEQADILRAAAKQYINQTCGKDKTAIPSDWCTYCVHRGNCMESFLRGEISMSSSRNEPRINRPSRANAPVRTSLPPVREQEVIDVEAVPVEPIVPAAARAVEVVPVAEAPIVETPVADVPVVETPVTEVITAEPTVLDTPVAETSAHEEAPKSPELSLFEQMFRQIQEMVEGNRQEIQNLKGELAARQSRREDTTRIQARLEDEERRSQELLDKLAETESRLATSEAQVEKQKALEFTESELTELRKYSTIIVFDTCSIMNCPNLLDGVNDGELVVVPKDVNNELEHHKTRFGADDRKFKAQKAITAIFNYKRRFPLAYADGLLGLVPEAYRARADEKEQNDNKILAVALRYKIYTDIPVLFITDDRSLSNKASGEGLEVWTSKDFLTPPETSFDDEVPTAEKAPAPVPVTEAQTAEAPAEAAPVVEISEEERLAAEAAEAERRAKAREEYLAQKISAKLLHLEASQISVLQNNGIKTMADFMAQTESSFAGMKVKKGIPFTARFLKEQETIRRKLENL